MCVLVCACFLKSIFHIFISLLMAYLVDFSSINFFPITPLLVCPLIPPRQGVHRSLDPSCPPANACGIQSILAFGLSGREKRENCARLLMVLHVRTSRTRGPERLLPDEAIHLKPVQQLRDELKLRADLRRSVRSASPPVHCVRVSVRNNVVGQHGRT